MKTKRILALMLLMILTVSMALTFPIPGRCTENDKKEGKVYAAVFYGRNAMGTRSAAEGVYNLLLENKLPGYRTEKENIHFAGSYNHWLKDDESLTREDVDHIFEDSFSGCSDQDLGIVYYAGHCYKKDTGGLAFGWVKNLKGEGWVGFSYPYIDLLQTLGKYDLKRLILIIDGCYAGMIKTVIENSSDDALKKRLCVLTSTGGNTENENNEESFFAFTKGILSTSVYPEPGSESKYLYGEAINNEDQIYCDVDEDGVITAREAFLGGAASPTEYEAVDSLTLGLLGLFYPYINDNGTLHHPCFYPEKDKQENKDIPDVPLFQFQYLEMNRKAVEVFEGNKKALKLKASRHSKMPDQYHIRWTSEDEKTATVDQEGNVTVIGPGTTTITAHLDTADNVECLGAEATCQLTVKRVFTDLEEDEISLYTGQKSDIACTVEGPKKKCTWTSGDTSIAKVKNGTVEGISPGITEVTLEANGKSDTIQVKVLEPYIEADSLTLKAGKSGQIRYSTYGPMDRVTFSSSDTNVASVDESGRVHAANAGTALITLKAGKVTTVITVTVEKLNTMDDIGLSCGHYQGIRPQGDGALPVELDLNKDGTFRLQCVVDPFTGYGSDCIYSGRYQVDRIGGDGYPVLSFHSGKRDFEMVYTGSILQHSSFFVFTD